MDKPLRAAGVCSRRVFCVVLSAAVCATLGCNKELEQPVLPAAQTPVSNSLRAPRPVDPGQKQRRMALPERKWGVSKKEDGVTRPLTSANREVLAAQAKSLNDHPEGLQRGALQAALDAQMGALGRCFDGGADVASVGIYFEADPSGDARGVHVRGASPQAETCVAVIFSNLRFPPFKGSPVPVDFPISIRQRVETIPAPQPSQPREPQAVFATP